MPDHESGDRSHWRSLIETLDPRSRIIGLVALLAEAAFGGVIPFLPEGSRLFAFVTLVVALVFAMLVVVYIETHLRKVQPDKVLIPSPKTPDQRFLNEMINSFIQAACRAVSIPHSPDHVDLRAFVFQRQDEKLVCTHYWALHPTDEKVGVTQFLLAKEVAEKVAVVRAVMERKICRTHIEPLPRGFEGAKGEIKESLRFVIAAPIIGPDGEVWGTFDLDSGNDRGEELLSSGITDSALSQLARHIGIILGLGSQETEDVEQQASAGAR